MILIRFDENISRRIPEAIKQLRLPDDVTIESAAEMNQSGQADVDWIASFRQRQGRCIVSGDERMRDRPPERAALESAEVVAVFPPEGRFWTPLRLFGQAAFLIRWYPVIERLAREAPAGAHFRLPSAWSAEYDKLQSLPRLADD